jgi:heptaprenylglyceryl phosphate synthase
VTYGDLTEWFELADRFTYRRLAEAARWVGGGVITDEEAAHYAAMADAVAAHTKLQAVQLLS